MVLSFSPPPEFFICSTKVFRPGEEHVTRNYGKSVLILMMDGELSFREAKKLVVLKKGEYYIQRQGLYQEGVKMDNTPIYFFIEFSGFYSQTGKGLPLRGTFDAAKIVHLMERIEDLFKNHKANPFLLNSHMHRIFSELLLSTPNRDERATIAHMVKNYIDAKYNSSLTLSDISHKFGYAEDYVVRMFRDTYGITPHKYLIQIRNEHARWLLENTAMTAEQIALSVGYSEFSSFFRNFRRTYGVSPSEIRNSLQEKQEESGEE